MRIVSSEKGRTVKSVTFVGFGNATDDEIATEAMRFFNEDRSSLWGWNVFVLPGFTADEDTALVNLYTD